MTQKCKYLIFLNIHRYLIYRLKFTKPLTHPFYLYWILYQSLPTIFLHYLTLHSLPIYPPSSFIPIRPPPLPSPSSFSSNRSSILYWSHMYQALSDLGRRRARSRRGETESACTRRRGRWDRFRGRASLQRRLYKGRRAASSQSRRASGVDRRLRGRDLGEVMKGHLGSEGGGVGWRC